MVGFSSLDVHQDVDVCRSLSVALAPSTIQYSASWMDDGIIKYRVANL